MSVGRFLDDAAAALRRADARMAALAAPDRYDVTAAVAARDQLYQQLGRFLASFTRREPGQLLNMQDAISLLGEDGAGTVARSTVLATGIKAATLGLDPTPADLLHGRSAVAPIAVATESLQLATEIVATHLHPTSPTVQSGWSWTGSPRHLTREGSALAHGAQRPEAVGEVARLTLAAVRLDRHLLAWKPVNPDLLLAGQWDQLQQWTGSGYPAELQRMASADQAILLSHLQPAPVTERSTGPRDITSWADAIAAVAATRSAIQRQPAQATIAVTRAAARLGFAATAAGWRLSGRDEPTPRTSAHADRWRELAAALDDIADIRDSIHPALAEELNNAKNWVRTQVAGRTSPATLADLGGVIELQQETQRLCSDLRGHLVRAKHSGDLLTGEAVLDASASHGQIVMAVQHWSRAVPNDSQIATMMNRLQEVSTLPVSVPLTGALRHTSAMAFTATAGTGAAPAANMGQDVSASARHNGYTR